MEISVIDTGTGIKDKDKDKLFKFFGYIHDEQHMNVHGIGLGLNISKHILEQFDGKIDVDSVFGKGSTFKFRLKLYKKLQLQNQKNQEKNQFYDSDVLDLQYEWLPPNNLRKVRYVQISTDQISSDSAFHEMTIQRRSQSNLEEQNINIEHLQRRETNN